jgi:hypothetical protein
MFSVNDRIREEIYIIENHQHVRQAYVVRSNGGFTVIEFTDGAQICLRNSRIYRTREEAEEELTREGRCAVHTKTADRRMCASSMLGPYAYLR